MNSDFDRNGAPPVRHHSSFCSGFIVFHNHCGVNFFSLVVIAAIILVSEAFFPMGAIQAQEPFERARTSYLQAIELMEQSAGNQTAAMRAVALFEMVPPIAEGIDGAQELAAAALIQAATLAANELNDSDRARRNLEAVVDLYSETSWISHACSALASLQSGDRVAGASSTDVMAPLRAFAGKADLNQSFSNSAKQATLKPWNWSGGGISLEIPEKGWELLPHPSSDPVILHLMRRKPSSGRNPGYPNITLAHEKTSLGLDEYFRQTGEALIGMSSWRGPMNILSESSSIPGVNPGMIRVFIADIRGISITHVQAYIQSGEEMFMFTLADLEFGLKSSRPLFDKMLESLQISP